MPWLREDFQVSIPIGFSNELQRKPPIVFPAGAFHVSIPIGFSNELQLAIEMISDIGLIRFNPYRVFQ